MKGSQRDEGRSTGKREKEWGRTVRKQRCSGSGNTSQLGVNSDLPFFKREGSFLSPASVCLDLVTSGVAGTPVGLLVVLELATPPPFPLSQVVPIGKGQVHYWVLVLGI